MIIDTVIDQPILILERLKPGHETGLFGVWLTNHFQTSGKYPGHRVYYDHGDTASCDNVVVPQGFLGDKISRETCVTNLDAMVLASDGTVALIVEIEEKASSPKKFLGDVFAALMCEKFAIKHPDGHHIHRVTKDTVFIVACMVPDRGYRLKKIENAINPQLKLFSGLPDGISPAKVQFLFRSEIGAAINDLEAAIQSMFPVAAPNANETLAG
ncbi:MAG TPA: hypothetical protein VGK19_24945 [Capsulimonadaceae bacterium]